MLLGLSTPWPLPMGLPAGMTLAAPAAFEPAGHDRIVAGVDQHLEALLDQLLGRLQRGDRVGQQRLRVAQAFQLDPVGAGIAEVARAARGPGGRGGWRPRR